MFCSGTLQVSHRNHVEREDGGNPCAERSRVDVWKFAGRVVTVFASVSNCRARREGTMDGRLVVEDKSRRYPMKGRPRIAGETGDGCNSPTWGRKEMWWIGVRLRRQ